MLHALGYMHDEDGIIHTDNILNEAERAAISTVDYASTTFDHRNASLGPADLWLIRQEMVKRGMAGDFPAVAPGAADSTEFADILLDTRHTATLYRDTTGELSGSDGNDALVPIEGHCSATDVEPKSVLSGRFDRFCIVSGDFDAVYTGKGNDLVITAPGQGTQVFMQGDETEVHVPDMREGETVHLTAQGEPDHTEMPTPPPPSENTVSIDRRLFDDSDVRVETQGGDIRLVFPNTNNVGERGNITFVGQNAAPSGEQPEGVHRVTITDQGRPVMELDARDARTAGAWEDIVTDIRQRLAETYRLTAPATGHPHRESATGQRVVHWQNELMGRELPPPAETDYETTPHYDESPPFPVADESSGPGSFSSRVAARATQENGRGH